MAQSLEDMDEVVCYVKNQGLEFVIPYLIEGEEKKYYPDFIVHVKDTKGEILNLIVEVTGEKKKDKIALEWLQGHFGGSVHLQGDATHTWSVCGDTARKFAQDILPYVVVKIDQVKGIAEQPLTGRRYRKRSGSTHGVA